MRTLAIILIGLTVLSVVGPHALAAPDELEQLLFGEAVVAENEPLAASAVADAKHVVSDGSAGGGLSDASTYSQRAAWDTPADLPAGVNNVSHRQIADVSDARTISGHTG